MLDITKILPILSQLDNRYRQEFRRVARIRDVASGQFVALEEQTCHYYHLVRDGCFRVYKGGECGREVTLYHVRAGEGCILTALAILNGGSFPANSVADQPASLIEIPAQNFREWVHASRPWRDFVFSDRPGQLLGMLSTIESLAFQRVDQRIAVFLAEEARSPLGHITMTHSHIARELGTVREVVSRVLKGFERQNLIRLSRGKITVLNPDALLNHRRFHLRAG